MPTLGHTSHQLILRVRSRHGLRVGDHRRDGGHRILRRNQRPAQPYVLCIHRKRRLAPDEAGETYRGYILLLVGFPGRWSYLDARCDPTLLRLFSPPYRLVRCVDHDRLLWHGASL